MRVVSSSQVGTVASWQCSEGGVESGRQGGGDSGKVKSRGRLRPLRDDVREREMWLKV